MRVLPLFMLLLAAPAAANAQTITMMDCATFVPMLAAIGESGKGMARGAQEVDLSGLRGKVDSDTLRAIARLDEANVKLQPAMAEWAAAVADLGSKIRVACVR